MEGGKQENAIALRLASLKTYKIGCNIVKTQVGVYGCGS
jgi:hypothetical protein